LLDKLGINGHRNFYALRHTFQTVADEAGDPIVTRMLMGHVRDDDIGDVYRERVSDERLRKGNDHVRAWLHGGADRGTPSSRQSVPYRASRPATTRRFASGAKTSGNCSQRMPGGRRPKPAPTRC